MEASNVNKTNFSLAAIFLGICLHSAFVLLRWLKLARIYFSTVVSLNDGSK